MRPGCVLAEVEGQDMTTHGAGVQDMDGSDSDHDGEMDGGFESAEIFGAIAHGVQRIPGLWEATNAEALRRALNCDCEPMPTSLTEVDSMLLNISKAYGTPLSAMKEFDQVLQNVIHKMVEAGLPAEQVPHLYTRADIPESEFKRVVQENSLYVTFEVLCLLKRNVEAH
jgi:hypothetical protein